MVSHKDDIASLQSKSSKFISTSCASRKSSLSSRRLRSCRHGTNTQSELSVSSGTSDRNRTVRIATEIALAIKSAMVEEKYHEQKKIDKANDLERERLNNPKTLEEIKRDAGN